MKGWIKTIPWLVPDYYHVNPVAIRMTRLGREGVLTSEGMADDHCCSTIMSVN